MAPGSQKVLEQVLKLIDTFNLYGECCLCMLVCRVTATSREVVLGHCGALDQLLSGFDCSWRRVTPLPMFDSLRGT